jgi:BA14K-like protein
MIKATVFCAQFAAAAVVLSIGGAAFARDQPGEIGCVDGMPAPPWTQICPPTDVNKPFAEASVDRNGSCAQKHRSFDAASSTYLGRDGLRHVCR